MVFVDGELLQKYLTRYAQPQGDILALVPGGGGGVNIFSH